MSDTRFERAMAEIDEANASDPATIVIDGVTRPKEQAHAELMTRWVLQLDPDASPEQQLAARAHHIQRWTITRDEYPEGRAGYLRWRAALKRMHAEIVAAILSDVGYDGAFIGRVQAIVSKKGLGSDPAAQTHEDALCLVFLTTQFDDLIDRLGPDKAVDVVAKTIVKMSEQGRSVALGLPLSPAGADVVGRALALD